VIVLDKCAVPSVIPWPPTGSSVQEFLDRFQNYLYKRLLQADVFLVFNCYVQSSTKDATRTSRKNKSSRVYTITSTTRLPAQSVVLTVSKNKVQLIDIIVSNLRLYADEFQTKRLIGTGKNPFPTKPYQGQTF